MIKKRFKTENGNFNYIPFHTIHESDIPKLMKNRKVSENGYILLPMSFDIETTSYYSERYKSDLATMYIWQFGIGRNTIIGRTWSEFKALLELIVKFTIETGNAFIWVHNLSFEFQFIKQLIEWNKNKDGYPDIFAKSDRQIIYAKYKNLEFRDSLALTGMGLAKLKKNYNLDIGKLSGDLDYDLKRTTITKVTNKELAYCINDVQVLNDWQFKYIFPEYLEKGKTPPLTSTGIVRQDIKEEFLKLDKDERKRLQTKIRNAQPTEEMYQIFRNYLFRGGLTHANTLLCNEMASIDSFDDSSILPSLFASLDLKSAHPAAMLQEDFPWKFYRRNKSLFYESVLPNAKTGKYAFFGIFKFKNIRTKTWHSLESKNKIIEASPDAVYDNGRLVYSSYIKVALTEIDWFNYEDIYEWEDARCTVLYEAFKYPLPDYVRKTICKYFELKETTPKDTFEYGLAKRKLNSVFGMAATSLPEREVVYDPETNRMILSDTSKGYDELIRWLLMLPQWAIWTAAYTRRKIVQSIVSCGNGGIDSIYYDTDSNKVLNFENYKEWFESFNASQMEKSINMDTYDFDKSFFLHLGSFELEYIGGKYKVLGAKRYIVEKYSLIPDENGDIEYCGERFRASDESEIQVTVAGMSKGSLEAYCKETGKDIWEEFRDDLSLSPEYSDKQTAIYCDDSFDDEITDYQGVTNFIHENSCVAIVNIPFTMSLEEEFIKRIKATKEERERMIYKGVL